MQTLLDFISTVAPFIYILSALGGFFALRALYLARQSRRIAAFGLEREAAEQRQRRAINTLLTLAFVCGAVYISSNIIRPNMDFSSADDEEEASADLTPTAEVSNGETTPVPLLYPTLTSIPGFPEADAGERIVNEGPYGICEYPQIVISEPEAGANISGQVDIFGQANVFPFFEYKIEVRGAGTNNEWVLVTSDNETVSDGYLGTWDTTSFSAGDYTLRLIVYLSADQVAAPCEVTVSLQ